MKNRNTGSRSGTLRRGMLASSMRSVSTRSVASLSLFSEGVPCGDKTLRRHKNGYPLASLKVLKPIVHQKRVFSMFECQETSVQSYVDFNIKIVRNNFGIGPGSSSSRLGFLTSSLRSSKRSQSFGNESEVSIEPIPSTPKLKLSKLKHSAKGSARLVVDNNILHLFKGLKKKISANSSLSEKSLRKSTRFSWMHIYSVEKELNEDSFTLIFYEGRDDSFLKQQAHESDSYLFKIVTIKPKDSSEVGNILGEVYRAIRAQATVALETAKMLSLSSAPIELQRAESFLRLSVDLFSVCSGAEDRETLESLDALIELLEKDDQSNAEEIDFWSSRRNDLEGSLHEKHLGGEAAHGFVL